MNPSKQQHQHPYLNFLFFNSYYRLLICDVRRRYTHSIAHTHTVEVVSIYGAKLAIPRRSFLSILFNQTQFLLLDEDSKSKSSTSHTPQRNNLRFRNCFCITPSLYHQVFSLSIFPPPPTDFFVRGVQCHALAIECSRDKHNIPKMLYP